MYLHEDDESRKICYDLVLGEKEKVNIAVLPYLYTTKNQGISAQVEGWCRREGHTYVCADYHGVSQSAGRGDDGTLTRWIADTIEVLENAVPGSRNPPWRKPVAATWGITSPRRQLQTTLEFRNIFR